MTGKKKKKKTRPRILYPTKLFFKSEGEIKTFSDKQKLRVFVDSWHALQEIVKYSFEKREILYVRNWNLHKVRKSIKEGISEGNF